MKDKLTKLAKDLWGKAPKDEQIAKLLETYDEKTIMAGMLTAYRECDEFDYDKISLCCKAIKVFKIYESVNDNA